MKASQRDADQNSAICRMRSDKTGKEFVEAVYLHLDIQRRVARHGTCTPYD